LRWNLLRTNPRARVGRWLVFCPALAFLAAACGTPKDSRDAARNDSVTGIVWEWAGTTTPVDEIVVAAPERYTLELLGEGTARVQFDCNRGSGTYTMTEHELAFGVFMSTRMACPEDSLDVRYESDLSRVKSFFLSDGMLYLELPFDSGTMRFRAASPE